MTLVLATKDDELIYLARQFDYLREVMPNRGQRIEAVQRWCGGEPGQSWCAYWVTMLLDIVYKGHAPLPRTGSCDVLLEEARKHGWLTDAPKVGDLYLVLRSPKDAHHVGICVGFPEPGRILTISGNTNNDGSDNGDGVYEKEIAYTPERIVFIGYPRWVI